MDAFTGIAIGHRMKQMNNARNESVRIAHEWKAYAEELERELAEWKAHAAGLGAQVDALLATHPDTPLRQKVNIRFKDPEMKGAFKNKIARIYEEAHDARARELGIRHPHKIRQS